MILTELGQNSLVEACCYLCGNNNDAGKMFKKQGMDIVRCAICNLVYAGQKLPDEGLSKMYSEYYFTKNSQDDFGYLDYLSDKDLWIMSGAERIAEIQRHKSTGKILDIGSAYGFFLSSAKANGWDAYGVELSSQGSEYARQQGLQIHNGQLADAGFADQYFDVIVIDDCIEHVPNPIALLKEVNRILKPNGIITLTTPNVGGLQARIMGKHWFHYKPIEHLFYLSAITATDLLNKTGFEATDVRPTGRIINLRYLIGRIDYYNHKIAKLLNKFFSNEEVRLHPFYFMQGGMKIFAKKISIRNPPVD